MARRRRGGRGAGAGERGEQRARGPGSEDESAGAAGFTGEDGRGAGDDDGDEGLDEDEDDDGAHLDEALDRALASLPEGPRTRRPTRREKRRGAEEAIDLGKVLVELPPLKLEKLPLPEDIAEAVHEARRIRSHAAKKRQLQFLGRLLRQSDDLDAIQSAYERLSDLDRKGTAEFQRVERWRARLLEEGEPALDALCVDYPEADRGKLWRLVEEARRESAQGRPPAAFRALFRELRDLAAR